VAAAVAVPAASVVPVVVAAAVFVPATVVAPVVVATTEAQAEGGATVVGADADAEALPPAPRRTPPRRRRR